MAISSIAGASGTAPVSDRPAVESPFGIHRMDGANSSLTLSGVTLSRATLLATTSRYEVVSVNTLDHYMAVLHDKSNGYSVAIYDGRCPMWSFGAVALGNVIIATQPPDDLGEGVMFRIISAESLLRAVYPLPRSTRRLLAVSDDVFIAYGQGYLYALRYCPQSSNITLLGETALPDGTQSVSRVELSVNGDSLSFVASFRPWPDFSGETALQESSYCLPLAI